MGLNATTRDDLERLRLALAGRRADEPEPPGGGMPAFVGEVTSSASNIRIGSFLLVRPMVVLGAEVEGGGASLTPAFSSPTVTVPVLLLGPGLPSTGDDLVCRFVDNRWVAERTSPPPQVVVGPVGTIPNCFCSPLPATLTMTSADPDCNGGMFQPCTIQYGPTPAPLLALGLAPYNYLSTESFPDPIEGGAPFYYLLDCLYDHFELTRVYPSSPFANPPGGPARDGVLYSWNLGGYQNTCKPFHLDYGTPMPGSDPTCFVTIDQAD